MACPDADRLYELGFAAADPFTAEPDPHPSEDEAFDLALGTLVEPRRPTVWRYSGGQGGPTDLVPTTTIVVVLVSPRFRAALSDARVTGWTSRPVDLHGRNDEPITGYERLVVTGRCGPLDTDNSPETINGARMRHGSNAGAGTWDGSDISSPAPKDASVLLTQRAHDAIRSLTNVHLKRLSRCRS